MKKLNLNAFVKVKFTDHGKDVYYHQYDWMIELMKARGVQPIAPEYPMVDENGYSTMQLWCFIELYGPHIGMCKPAVIEDLNIYIDECNLGEVNASLADVIPFPTEVERDMPIPKVKSIHSGRVYEVYGISGSRFLIWKDGAWQYEPIESYVPLESGPDKKLHEAFQLLGKGHERAKEMGFFYNPRAWRAWALSRMQKKMDEGGKNDEA